MIGFTTNRCLVVIHVLRMTCWYVQFRSSSRSTRDSTTHLELLSPWIYSMTGRKLEKTQEKRKNAASKLQTSSHYPIIPSSSSSSSHHHHTASKPPGCSGHCSTIARPPERHAFAMLREKRHQNMTSCPLTDLQYDQDQHLYHWFQGTSRGNQWKPCFLPFDMTCTDM